MEGSSVRVEDGKEEGEFEGNGDSELSIVGPGDKDGLSEDSLFDEEGSVEGMVEYFSEGICEGIEEGEGDSE